MLVFFLFIFIILFIGYIVSKFTAPKPKITAHNGKTNPNPQHNSIIYKKRGVKTFEIRGIKYRKGVNLEDQGGFDGYVKTEKKSQDKNAVAIYDGDNKLIGYVPKGNIRLSESLNLWHEGKLMAWGYFEYDEFNRRWQGSVSIPVGLSDKQLSTFNKTHQLENQNRKILDLEKITSPQYFEYLENYKTIKKLSKELIEFAVLDYYVPKNLIPAISKQLEKEKDWNRLRDLEKFDDLINDLSETFKPATLRRIEKAKNNLAI